MTLESTKKRHEANRLKKKKPKTGNSVNVNPRKKHEKKKIAWMFAVNPLARRQFERDGLIL